MDIQHCVALVTGANRGLGQAYAQALLDAGAAKVYAATRDPAAIADPRLHPLRLDVSSKDEPQEAAAICADVNLLINNAGVMLATSALARDAEAAMRIELEVNVFGILRMAQAFAPVLARNGGGAMVNVLSVASWFAAPAYATYGASKHAAEALTDALRIQLRSQGTRVLGVYAGFIDTDMAAAFAVPKTAPRQVAARTLEALREGRERVLADARAEDAWRAMRADPEVWHARMQRQWDEQHPARQRRDG